MHSTSTASNPAVAPSWKTGRQLIIRTKEFEKWSDPSIWSYIKSLYGFFRYGESKFKSLFHHGDLATQLSDLLVDFYKMLCFLIILGSQVILNICPCSDVNSIKRRPFNMITINQTISIICLIYTVFCDIFFASENSLTTDFKSWISFVYKDYFGIIYSFIRSLIIIAGEWLKLIPFIGAVGGVSYLIYKQVKPKHVVNLDIKKDSSKVVDMCDIEDITAEKTVYCRCWRSNKVLICI